MQRALAILALGTFLPALHAQDCVGSVAVTTFRLSASPTGSGTPVWMPVRQLNNLPSGYRVRYQPGTVPAEPDKNAAVALVLVPKTGDGQFTVLQPGPIASTTEWTVPFDASIAMLVVAPQGLDEKRLTNLIARDPTMVSSLVEYAEQTRELEDTLAALRDLDDDAEAAARPGRAVTPTEQALQALVRALNPAVSSYDPLGAGRRTGPATMMGRGANLFFENAGSMVPGGGALPMVKQFLMPDTEFRSVYAAGADGGSMTLCAQRQLKTRNKIAYVWAYRLTSAPAPTADVVGDAGNVADAAIGQRSSIALRMPPPANWALLDRVTDWGLVSASGAAPIHIPARVLITSHELQLDLRMFAGLAGEYAIEGRWDWGTMRLNGSVRLHHLDELSTTKVTPESLDRLVAGSGLVALDLTGANLRFVTQAWLHRPESERRVIVDLPSRHEGPADQLHVELDTDGLHPGAYLLTVQRVDGASVEIPVQVLPPPPVIESAGLRVHAGEREQTVLLTGNGLDRVESVEAAQANVALKPATDRGTHREAVVQFRPDAMVGQRVEFAAKAVGVTGALHFPGVLQVAPARPHIVDAKTTLPADLPVALHEGELPAGSFVNFTLHVEPAPSQPEVTVNCEGAPAERGMRQMIESPAPGTIFFALDPGTAGPSGCKLAATVNANTGTTDPFLLGTVVRVPRIDKLTLTNESIQGGFAAILEGWDLQAIERTGWGATQGLAVNETPRPIAGQGAKQTLRIVMPWPSPAPRSPVFVWLHGEAEGRATKVAP